MCGKPKKGKRAMRRQWRRKRARFEEGSRFSGATRTETGQTDTVFPRTIVINCFKNFYKVLKNCSAGRKDFFDTLRGLAESEAPETVDEVVNSPRR